MRTSVLMPSWRRSALLARKENIMCTEILYIYVLCIYNSSSRSATTNLQTHLTTLKTVRAKLKAKCVKDTNLSKYEQELLEMTTELNAFINKCTELTAEVDFEGKEKAPDAIEVTLARLEAHITTAEHHKVGAQVAKHRFQGLGVA